ncbi:MAG: primosomal replication protein N [Gammaproteobacteria bacterium]|nr:primosomal replication protein N [Gammaproteobacteria bacterium]MBQ0775059.1 primosomal replication protein N [Gammaproteobacteria bacterium]
MSTQQNCCVLTGQIAEIEPVRRTPAGIPRQRLWLEHRSRQEEAGSPREVHARLAVVLSGDDLIRVAATCAVGLQIRAEGFIARAGMKGEARDRLQLHAQSLTRLD